MGAGGWALAAGAVGGGALLAGAAGAGVRFAPKSPPLLLLLLLLLPRRERFKTRWRGWGGGWSRGNEKGEIFP